MDNFVCVSKKESSFKLKEVDKDFWQDLRRFTSARIALGHCGASMPTTEYLNFSLDHARARDAVHLPFQKELVRDKLVRMGLQTIDVHSLADNRSVYLINPDKGRRLNEESCDRLREFNSSGYDVVLVIADGLSSKAVHKQAVPLIGHLLPYLKKLKLSVAPIVLAEQSRVALGDEIAELLRGKLVAILIGERPGLSSPDSLGVYMTWNPKVGRLESERNCISNVRPEGLNYGKAAFKMAWLMEAAFESSCTGIGLKDQSDDPECYRLLRPMNLLEK